MDFRVLTSEAPWVRSWSQEVEGTPFARVLAESVIEIHLEPAGEGATEVTIAQRQKLRGYSRTGGLLLRRATDRQARRGARRTRAGPRLTTARLIRRR